MSEVHRQDDWVLVRRKTGVYDVRRRETLAAILVTSAYDPPATDEFIFEGVPVEHLDSRNDLLPRFQAHANGETPSATPTQDENHETDTTDTADTTNTTNTTHNSDTTNTTHNSDTTNTTNTTHNSDTTNTTNTTHNSDTTNTTNTTHDAHDSNESPVSRDRDRARGAQPESRAPTAQTAPIESIESAEPMESTDSSRRRADRAIRRFSAFQREGVPAEIVGGVVLTGLVLVVEWRSAPRDPVFVVGLALVVGGLLWLGWTGYRRMDADVVA